MEQSERCSTDRGPSSGKRIGKGICVPSFPYIVPQMMRSELSIDVSSFLLVIIVTISILLLQLENHPPTHCLRKYSIIIACCCSGTYGTLSSLGEIETMQGRIVLSEAVKRQSVPRP